MRFFLRSFSGSFLFVFSLCYLGASLPSRGEDSVAAAKAAVLFSKKDGAVGGIRSEIIFLDNLGLGVVVADVAADYRSGKFLGEGTTLVAHDSLSRLTLLRVSLPKGEMSEPVELGTSLSLRAGAELYSAQEGDVPPSRIVSRESVYKEKPLPLELIRIHNGEETRVRPGDPFYDSAGRLAAIAYRPVSEFGNGTFAFPVEALKRLLDATVVDGLVQRSWFGVELLASDPFAVAQGVRQDSPAAKAGLVKGDIILQIGPRVIENYSNAINAFFYLREGEPTTVRFLRGTEQISVEVMPELVPPPAELPTKDVGA